MPSGSQNRLRAIFELVLLIGSIAATIVAVTTVVVLFVWAYSLPGPHAEPAAAPPAPRPRAARPAPANAAPVAAAQVKPPPAPAHAAPAAPNKAAPVPAQAAPAAPQKPAPAPAQAAIGAPSKVPPAPAPQGVPTYGPNSDAAKNRAIGAGLARLAHDPEALRKLKLGPAAAP